MQPVMRSLRRNHWRLLANNPGRETKETVRAERREPSTVDRQQSKKPRSNEDAPGYRAVRGRGADERLPFTNEPNGRDRRPRLRGTAGDPSQADRREAEVGIPEQKYEPTAHAIFSRGRGRSEYIW